MVAIEKRALAWRSKQEITWLIWRSKKTQVRAFVATLRNEAELQEGRRRLRLSDRI